MRVWHVREVAGSIPTAGRILGSRFARHVMLGLDLSSSRFAPHVMLGLDPSICRREKDGGSERANDVRAERDARVETEHDGTTYVIVFAGCSDIPRRCTNASDPSCWYPESLNRDTQQRHGRT